MWRSTDSRDVATPSPLGRAKAGIPTMVSDLIEVCVSATPARTVSSARLTGAAVTVRGLLGQNCQC